MGIKNGVPPVHLLITLFLSLSCKNFIILYIFIGFLYKKTTFFKVVLYIDLNFILESSFKLHTN